ncbi:hypothetical protein [Cronobacter dublinensis]|uniref:hypothetical protein n=1 Tax=Cronobacter dublinensis TaxID=413497 RepID=UPI0024AFED23|nr:hypothetical protein [Cronobacter dublinensis]MDI7502009.1 hypothetical protein [Cronobacter dublinensis]
MSEIADLQSELNDETLAELIDFRRTTYRHHVEQENKVQATLHGLVLVALMELQEHRKACALRERAEPVAESDHVRREVHVGGNTWVQCSAQAYERAKAEGKITRELFERPGQPVAVTDETFDEWSRRCEIQLTLCRPEFREVAEVTWNACRGDSGAAKEAV